MVLRVVCINFRQVILLVPQQYKIAFQFECGCCEMLAFRVCGARQNFYVFRLYRNPDLDDRIYDCLLTAMAAVQAADVCASFLFVGDLNGHHQE